jgi:GxxExxY protein
LSQTKAFEPSDAFEPRRHECTKTVFEGKLPGEIESIGKAVVDCAFKVHSALGPGLLESVYGTCLDHELRKRGLSVQKQFPVAIRYDSVRIESGFRLDLLVNEMVVVEVKSVERVLPVHQAQLLSYLRLSGLRLGFLINFNVPVIREGIIRRAL